MRRSLAAVLVAASVAWLPSFNLGAAQEVTGDTRILANATYVAIGFGAGGGGFVSDAESGKSMDVSQEDRAALVAIRKQFETWHRYVLTSFPKNAELLVTVRTGRQGHVAGRTAVGGPPSGLTGGGAGASSPPDDMLCVYTSVGGKARAMVWQRALPNGLSGSPAPLFEQFRSAVDAAAKKRRP
jgi:hypothetical protein